MTNLNQFESFELNNTNSVIGGRRRKRRRSLDGFQTGGMCTIEEPAIEIEEPILIEPIVDIPAIEPDTAVISYQLQEIPETISIVDIRP